MNTIGFSINTFAVYIITSIVLLLMAATIAILWRTKTHAPIKTMVIGAVTFLLFALVIEQPIKAGQWAYMARLCRESPLPIALDEELIGVNDPEQKRQLLHIIKPAYIVLKPSLHGGMAGCREWIDIAREEGVGSWITSALESVPSRW